jgi:hypothetical protein
MRRALAVAVLLWAAAPLAAQSLPEAADKQKKERKGQAKVYTDDDLRKAGARTATPPEIGAPADAAKAEPAAAATKPKADEKTDDQLRAEKKADLEKKFQEQQAIIVQVRKAMDDAQRELSDLSNYTMGPRRAALAKVVDDGNAAIAKANAAIADVEEQARRAGVSVSR